MGGTRSFVGEIRGLGLASWESGERLFNQEGRNGTSMVGMDRQSSPSKGGRFRRSELERKARGRCKDRVHPPTQTSKERDEFTVEEISSFQKTKYTHPLRLGGPIRGQEG